MCGIAGIIPTKLRQLASDLGIERHVRFVGMIPYLDMPLWYNLSDAVVMVPRSDGMPNSLLEAMACGTVPILARLPQYAELLQHGVNGFLVNPHDEELAQAVLMVLSDPGMKARMGVTNRTTIIDIGDQDREMSRMEEWYHKLAIRV